MRYRKQQKLSNRKVSRFTGIHPNVGRFCFICIESAAVAQSIRRENFRGSSKIHENREGFLLRSFCGTYVCIVEIS